MGEPASFRNGALIANGYEVVQLLDRGGMGAVYEVIQLATGARRALKVMHVQLASDPAARARFLHEVRITANIASDHVAHVIDAGVDPRSGLPFFVMDLLLGLPLSREIRRRHFFDWAAAREVFRQLCHGVAAAHAAGVVHQDLKPANIFLAKPRTPGLPFVIKVLDFGIAEFVAGSRTVAPAVAGTPHWMAPEQFDDAAVRGPGADVWSLGLLAFAVLTGRFYWPDEKPLAGEDTRATWRRLTSSPLLPASERGAQFGVRERLPPGFDGWFARCTAQDPSMRFADAGEAHVVLDAIIESALELGERPSSLRPVSLGEDSPTAILGPAVSMDGPTRRVSEPPPAPKRRFATGVYAAGIALASAAAFGWSTGLPHGPAPSLIASHSTAASKSSPESTEPPAARAATSLLRGEASGEIAALTLRPAIATPDAVAPVRPVCESRESDLSAFDPSLQARLSGACRLSFDVRFDAGGYVLTGREMHEVERIAKVLKGGAFEGRHVALLGYADGRGLPGDNDWVSRTRAAAVARELRGRGVTVDLSLGMGSDKQRGPESKREPDSLRRVEIWLL